jgi:hypothetical protein
MIYYENMVWNWLCCHMDFRNVSSNLYTVIITRYNKSMFNVPWWKMGFNTKWRKTLNESNLSLNNWIKISVIQVFPCSTIFSLQSWWQIGCTILCKYLLKWLFVEQRYYVCLTYPYHFVARPSMVLNDNKTYFLHSSCDSLGSCYTHHASFT